MPYGICGSCVEYIDNISATIKARLQEQTHPLCMRCERFMHKECTSMKQKIHRNHNKLFRDYVVAVAHESLASLLPEMRRYCRRCIVQMTQNLITYIIRLKQAC
jgi:hypothetical protein